MTTQLPPIYEGQLHAYESSVECWKRDHDDAMRCRAAEAVLRVGIFLYDILNRADEEWRMDFAKGKAKDLSDSFDALFDGWLRPCAKVEGMIQECESLGFEVEGADDFRSRHAAALDSRQDR